MGLRLEENAAVAPAPTHRARSAWPAGDAGSLRFDRRREPRAAAAGWARLICLDPYKSFLGGTVELADVSRGGFGFRSPRAIPVGEYVEVRLAPFRVRGRIARVARCEESPEVRDEATGEVITPRQYRIGVQHAQSIRAA
ncbi:MAG: PilZ domain-containing protein [Phycisphaerales bacterium]|nr:PilZ domain-containing protein [Phycisphaerales bacterium]